MCEKGQEQKTVNSSQSTSADPRAQSIYSDVLGRAAGVANTPYQSYTGPLTAGTNAQQQLGISGINANAGYAQPYLQQANSMAMGAGNPLSQQQIESYLNPYTQNVVDATQAQFNTQNASQQADLKGNLITQGALGGNRRGVLEAELSGQQSRAQNPVIAGLYSQGYQGALNTAHQQYQQNPLAAGSAIAGYGLQGQQAALQGAGQQMGAGNLMQQNEQAGYDAAYKQFLQQQAYPFQTTQWYGNIAGSLAPQYGTSSTGNSVSTQPAPSQWAQIAGLGVAAASAFSDERVKEGVEPIGKSFDGQTLYRFRYKGSPQTHVGFLAQEVEGKHPEAVGSYGGVKTVDYDRATDDAAERGEFAAGGGVPGFAGGGVLPYAGADSWVPEAEMRVSQGPRGSQMPEAGFGAPRDNGMGKLTDQLTAYANSPDDPAGAPTSLMSSLGFSPSGVGDWFSGGTGGFNPAVSGLYADGGAVMSDADPEPGFAPGAQVASSQFQMRPTGNGQVQVINIRTGQVVYTGSASGAANAQASASQGQRRATGGRLWEEELPAGSFADRALPVERAIAEGEFDPQGSNSTEFRGSDPGVPGFEPPMPRARPPGAGQEPPGQLPPQITGPTDVAQAGFSGPAMGFAPEPPRPFARDEPKAGFAPAPPAPAAAPANPNTMGGFNPLNFSDKARMALIAGGLGVAASRNPSALGAIGEGGLAGVGSYARAQTEERRAIVEAQKLARDAQQQAQDLSLRTAQQTETGRHNRASEGTAKTNAATAAKSADREKWQYLGPAEDGSGSVYLNSNTGEEVIRGTKIGAKPRAAASNDGAPLSEDAVKLLASQVRAGDTRALVGLGRGAQGATDLRRVREEVARQVRGGEPVDPGAEVILKNAAEQAMRVSGARALGTKEIHFGVAEKAMEESLPVALEASKKVPRTQWLALTKMIQLGQTQINDPDLKRFLIATDTAAKDYARTINPQGVLRESDILYARKILSTADSAEAYEAALGQLKIEASVMKRALDRQKGELTGRGSKYDPKDEKTGAKPVEAKPTDAVGTLTAKDGTKWWVDKDRKPLSKVSP